MLNLNQTTKNTLTAFFLILSVQTLFGQVTQNYLSDVNVTKISGTVDDSYIKGKDYIIYGGISFDKFGLTIVIRKIDSIGNIIWSTSDLDSSITYSHHNSSVLKIIESEGYVYALNSVSQLWKIDGTNGSIVWKTNSAPQNITALPHIIDYDSTTIILTGVKNNSDGTRDFQINFLDKYSLNFKKIIDLGRGSSDSRDGISIGVDSDNNLYYTKYDSLFKRYSYDVDSLIFAKKLAPNSGTSFSELYFDQFDSLYLFGREGTYGAVTSVSKNDGTRLWNYKCYARDVNYRSMIEKNGKFFIIWRHIYFGGGSTWFIASSINKQTGTLNWETSHDFGYGSESAMSIDIDDSSNIFLTGYCKANSYGPGSWGVVKLSGIDGQNIFQTEITLDSSNNNRYSTGMVAAVFNNRPFFLGILDIDLSPSFPSRLVSYVELSSTTGETLNQKTIGTGYKYLNKVIKMRKVKDGIIVLKQAGRELILEKYNSNRNLVWSNRFNKNYYLKGIGLCADNNEVVTVSAINMSFLHEPPYYDRRYVDSLYYFKIDKRGKVINESAFEAPNSSITNKVFCDDSSSFHVYYNLNNNNFTIREQNSVPNFNETITQNLNLNGLAKDFLIKNDTSFFFFGSLNYKSFIVQFFKHSNTLSTYYEFDQLASIYSAFELDSNFLIVGRDKQRFEENKIILFDPFTKSILWEKSFTYTKKSSPTKTIIDYQDSSLFIASLDSSDINIYKHSMLDGSIIWNYEIKRSTFNNNSGFDMTLLPSNLVYTTFTKDSVKSNKKTTLLVESLNKQGSLVNRFSKKGEVNFDPELIIENFSTNDFWIGGYLELSTSERSGFLFEVDSTFNSPTSINEYKRNIKLSYLYPNPTVNGFSIKIDNYNDLINVKVVSLSGRILFNESTLIHNEYTFNENLNSGIYLVMIKLKNGETHSFKLLKNN